MTTITKSAKADLQEYALATKGKRKGAIFAAKLRERLEEFFNPIPEQPNGISWATAIKEFPRCYVVKVEMVLATEMPTTEIPEDLNPLDLHELVVWTFSDDNLSALIRLPKPLDFEAAAAELMAGNLFGQGVSREVNRSGG